MNAVMAVMSSLTLLKKPRRMAWRVMIETNTSTMLSQDPEVGVKCANAQEGGGDGLSI